MIKQVVQTDLREDAYLLQVVQNTCWTSGQEGWEGCWQKRWTSLNLGSVENEQRNFELIPVPLWP